jgi:hypothetical protein
MGRSSTPVAGTGGPATQGPSGQVRSEQVRSGIHCITAPCGNSLIKIPNFFGDEDGEHASTPEMHTRVCMVRAVRAGASTSWSHFDALQRRHVRRSDSTRASGRLRHISKAPVSRELQTLPWGLERIGPAQPLASARGVCRKPASYSMNFFDLLRNLEPSKKQDSGFLHAFWKMQEARVLLTILSVSCYRLPASKSATWEVAVRLERTQGAWPSFLTPASCKNPLSRCGTA